MKLVASILLLSGLVCGAQPLTLNDPVMLSGPISIGPLTFGVLTTYTNLGSPTTLTTASYTPSPNALLLAYVWIGQTMSVSSITGNGLTWVLVQSVENTVNNVQLRVYRAMSNAPIAGALTVVVNTGGSRGSIIQVQQFQNVITTGSNGSDAVVQAMPSTGNTITLSALNTNGLNAIVGASVSPVGAAADGFAEAGWTQDLNYGQVPSLGISSFVSHKTNSLDASYNSSMTNGTIHSIAMEIRAAKSIAYIQAPDTISSLAIWTRSDSGVYQDAAKTISCVTNGAPVYTWDNMGNTVLTTDFIQATGGLQPLYNVTGGVNNRPRISFNSSRLTLASGTISQPFTIVTIANCVTNVGGYSPYLWDSIGTSFLTVDGLLGNLPYVYAATLRYGTIAVNSTPVILTAVVNAANSALYTGRISNLAAGTVGTAGVVVSVSTGGAIAGTYFLVGDEYEIMVFSKALSIAEISQLMVYSKDRYASTNY